MNYADLKQMVENCQFKLVNSPYTIVMDNQKPGRSRIYTISLATHKQAKAGTAAHVIFSGSLKATYTYLQGIRDTLHYLISNQKTA